jgi:hypothetical protein
MPPSYLNSRLDMWWKMQTLRFYRVEDHLGGGLYNSDRYPSCIWEMQDAKGRHPHWYNDPKLEKQIIAYGGFTTDFFFAFCSLEQIKFWIYKDKWRSSVDANGFRVSVLDAQGFHGDTQGVFLPSTRVDIERLSILEI